MARRDALLVEPLVAALAPADFASAPGVPLPARPVTRRPFPELPPLRPPPIAIELADDYAAPPVSGPRLSHEARVEAARAALPALEGATTRRELAAAVELLRAALTGGG